MKPPRRHVLPRLVVVGLLVVHGAIHGLGIASWVGWQGAKAVGAVSSAGAALWSLAGVLVLGTAVLVAARSSRWWTLGGAAALASQLAIVSAWGEAWAGTVVNVGLVAAAVHGLVAEGRWGLRAEYRRRLKAWHLVPVGVPARASASRARPGLGPTADVVGEDAGVVTEDDLAALPASVARYLRRCGVVGRPRVTGFHARISGRIRGGPEQPWMSFTGEQANTYGQRARRLFLIQAWNRGMPVDVLHVFDDAGASMRARLCSILPILAAAGPEMDRGETVTVLNDLCLLAPAALVGAGVTWQELDDRRVRATWTREAQTVGAELVFDRDGDLVDFISDDRSRASRDGRSFTALRWSTPVQQHRTIDGRRLVTRGVGRWHAEAPEGTFTYVEFQVDDITYVTGPAAGTPAVAAPCIGDSGVSA